MAAKAAATLDQVMELIREGQASARQRHEDLKADFDVKHKENSDRRHALMAKVEANENRVYVLDGRIGALETQMVSIIGDNSGGSGLLHKIDRAVDEMRNEVTSIKKSVEDAPALRKWVLMAAGVVIFLGVVVPIVVTVIIAFAFRH